MPTTASRRSRRSTPHVRWMSVPPRLLSPLPAGVVAATKLAFATDRDGGFEIYVMDADGQNPVRLTSNSLSDFSPAWSPDGTRIAMDRRSPDTFDVWTMDADGQHQTRLTDNTGVTDNDEPAWR